MGSLFFKSVKIQNYKCFKESDPLEFNTPDGQEGSGLNILIGENGTGKTSILEAINFLTQTKYISENKLSISDFNDYREDLKIDGKIIKRFDCKSSLPYELSHAFFKCNGISFVAKTRNKKEANKILSSPFSVHNNFLLEDDKYYNGPKKETKVDKRDIIFSNGRIKKKGDKKDSINVFYFDKNRSRHLASGTYKTTLDKIWDNFNWTFIKNLKSKENKEDYTYDIKHLIKYFSKVLELAQRKTTTPNTLTIITINELAEEMNKFFKNDFFKDLKIDFLNILQPFSSASLVIRGDEELKQINVNNLGSGIEIMMTLLLLKKLSIKGKENSIIYLIDEPELHLHPKAQENLADFLLRESKDKQIIIATHSPYMYKNIVPHTGLFILKKNKEGHIEIKKKDKIKKENRLFPWSPSWGEISFEAYDMATVEFHNELYGYLLEIKIPDAKNTKSINGLDDYLESENLSEKKRKWKRSKEGEGKEVTLHTFIRHFIHHPENSSNEKYSEEDLKTSIKEMIDIIKKLKFELLNSEKM